MSSAAAPWPTTTEDALAAHLAQLAVEDYQQQQRHNQANSSHQAHTSVGGQQHTSHTAPVPSYANVNMHNAQRPPFAPYEGGPSPFLYYPAGMGLPSPDAYANPGASTPSFPFSELSSPLASLQSLPSLQSLSTLQNMMAANATGLAFDPYPSPPESYPGGVNAATGGTDARPANCARIGSNGMPNLPNFPHQQSGRGHNNQGVYRPHAQQPLTAQSTGQGYFYHADRQAWSPQSPGNGNGSQRGRHSRLNSNSTSPRRGGHRYGAADLSHQLNLQQLVYPPTPTPAQLNLAAMGQFAANPYSSAVAFGTLRRYDQTTRSGRLDEFRRHRNARMELADISGHICELAGDQHGSRFIQNKLETASAEDRARVFDEIMPNAYQLMTDVFGNYVIQKLFEHGDPAQKAALAKKMETHVLQLSMQMYGCRVVQKALEQVLLEQREKLVAELSGHVIECVKSANANHVIQRLISVDPPMSIIDAFKGHVRDLSCHPFGCRVLQKSFEILKPAKIRPLLNELHTCAGQLMVDQFGNYVVQSIITDAPDHEQDRDKVIEWIKPRIYEFSRHKFASNVVEKALKYANPADRRILISELMGEASDNSEERISNLLRDSYGNFPVQTALAEADPDQREKLLSIIIPLMPNIRHTPCGRRLEAKINEYDSKGIIPGLSHSLSADSVNLLNLDSDSEGTVGDPVGPATPAQPSVATMGVGASTPTLKMPSNVSLRRVATSPDSQDEGW